MTDIKHNIPVIDITHREKVAKSHVNQTLHPT